MPSSRLKAMLWSSARSASYFARIGPELVCKFPLKRPLNYVMKFADNVDDDVEKNLRKERETILAALNVLDKLHAETVEQIRKLRASIYLLDRDLVNKESSLQIDQQNLVLRENQIDMKIYEGRMELDP